MLIGIGLPNTLPISGPAIADWARRAEERGFHALATIDRIVYPSYDSITALAFAAGATSRIGLFTNILLTPLYPAAWLAKATASLDAMSGGRLTLGLGVGARGDDFVAMERPLHRRGQVTDETLDLLHRSWAGEPVVGDEFPVGPAPTAGGRVPVLIGGTSDATIRRMVRYGQGWTAGGGGPEMAAPMIEKVRAAWRDAGREGEPRIAGLVYFGLGNEEASRSSLRSYYGFLGNWTETIVDGALRSTQAVKDTARAYADAGFTELIYNPSVPSVAEVDLLADAVL